MVQQDIAISKIEKKSTFDPLSDFEASSVDMTGVCVNHADSLMADYDPETETSCSGRSILLVEDEYDPETETNCSGRSIEFVEDEYDPET